MVTFSDCGNDGGGSSSSSRYSVTYGNVLSVVRRRRAKYQTFKQPFYTTLHVVVVSR